jgi:hypothetical protein
MQLTDSLEHYLRLFHATITYSSKDEFTVEGDKPLPDSVSKIAKNVNISVSTMPIHVLGKDAIEDLVGEVNYEYVFADDAREALRALLFLATEKERYDKFCEAFDEEVEEELSDNNE